MNLSEIKYAYFLGIGGIGMSALARFFVHKEITVFGYDKTPTDLTTDLENETCLIHYEEDIKSLISLNLEREKTLVVLTPAIPKEHQELLWFIENKFNILKRSQVLGIISESYQTIAVAGTHGKTTTSTLIAHILKQSHVDCNAFLGGISVNYHTNLLLHKDQKQEQQFTVVEADEYDRSFLTLHPQISIITSTDADHLDIYGQHDELKKSFIDFSNRLVAGGTQIIKKGLDISSNLNNKFITYSASENADYYASNIRINAGDYFFDLNIGEDKIENLSLGIPGFHNVENAVAACAACLLAGVNKVELRNGLQSFNGVKRRFEYIIKSKDQIYIDDYAHHPEEIKAIISSVKTIFPDKELLVIFQPHLYSRTRDFVDGFASSLSLADNVFLLDIYPARELPIEGVTSQIIFDKLQCKKKQIGSKNDSIEFIKTTKPSLLLTLGAGDIDQMLQLYKSILEL